MDKMKHNLDLRQMKALFELYTRQKTRLDVSSIPYFSNYLIRQKKIVNYKLGNHDILVPHPGFKEYYDLEFKEDFEHYFNFLSLANIKNDARKKLSEYDIKTLVFIYENKEILASSLTTQRTFSSHVFKSKGSKYLENKPGLKEDVCRILGINDFPDKDPKNNQFRLVVDCLNPMVIVLCENMNSLKIPWKKQQANIELWYVGGNNVGIIDQIPDKYLSLPIYYACDWDYDGLKIYSRVKEKLATKQVIIKLLQPKNVEDALPVGSDHHGSQWKNAVALSALNALDFDEEQTKLINYLIKSNLWIEEESYDLIELLKTANNI